MVCEVGEGLHRTASSWSYRTKVDVELDSYHRENYWVVLRREKHDPIEVFYKL